MTQRYLFVWRDAFDSQALFEPFDGEPGVGMVPVERVVSGLVQEAGSMGITESSAVETYVAHGLAECGNDVEAIGIRHIIDGLVTSGDRLSVTEAARLAGVSKGTMSRWRKKYRLAAGDDVSIDAAKLAKLQETHRPRRRSGCGSQQNSRPATAPQVGNTARPLPTIREVVWRLLRCVGRATREDIVAKVKKARPETLDFESQRVLDDPQLCRLHPGRGLEPSYYSLCDD